MDSMDHPHSRRTHRNRGPLRHPRNISPSHSAITSSTTQTRNRQLGSTLQSRRKPNHQKDDRISLPNPAIRYVRPRTDSRPSHSIHVFHLRSAIPPLRSLPRLLPRRTRLERRHRLTPLPPIPLWHRSRRMRNRLLD